jgi:hypothetical protein
MKNINETMMCDINGCYIDFKRKVVNMIVPNNNAPDMAGTIKAGEYLCNGVLRIMVIGISPAKVINLYSRKRKGSAWECQT